MNIRRDCPMEITDERKTVAVIGNPNVGKSTVFNALDGRSVSIRATGRGKP